MFLVRVSSHFPSNLEYLQLVQSVGDNKLALCQKCRTTFKLSKTGDTPLKGHLKEPTGKLSTCEMFHQTKSCC